MQGSVKNEAGFRGGHERPPRQDAVLEATVRLLASEGPHGITHHRVASEAGVPLAATTYYFSSKDELLQEALRLAAARELDKLEQRSAELGKTFSTPGPLGRALAAALVHLVERERGSLLTKFDVYLQSARRPALRSSSKTWIEGFTRLATSALEAAGVARPAEAAELLVACADGLLIHHLATSGKGADTRGLAEPLERLADLLTGADAPS